MKVMFNKRLFSTLRAKVSSEVWKDMNILIIYLHWIGQSQSPFILYYILVTWNHIGPNVVILAWTSNILSCGQAQIEVKFDFQVKLTLKVDQPSKQ